MPQNLILLVLLLLIMPGTKTYSQCRIAPPLDSCNGTEPSLSDNTTLTSGVKRWYYGSPAVFNSITIRNGTLVVCGDITFNNFVIDSGTVVIRPGAKLKITGGSGVMNGNAAIYNYGTLEITSNMVLQGTYATAAKPNILMNVTPESFFKMSNQYFVINNPNSYFVNNGKAEFWGLITDYNAGQGCVCMGKHAEIYMTVLYNNSKFTYQSPEGNSCVKVNQYSQFRDTLTASPLVNVCLSPSHYSDSSCIPWGCKPNAWGAANVFNSCNFCTEISVLPFTWLDIRLKEKQSYNEITFQTSSAGNEYRYTVERSSDGSRFYPVDAGVISLSNNQYRCTDAAMQNGMLYYRIRYTHMLNGASGTSKTLFSSHRRSEDITLSPNPVIDQLHIQWTDTHTPVSLGIYNHTGRLLKSQVLASNNAHRMTIPFYFPAGDYVVKVNFKDHTVVKKIVKR